MPNQFSNDDQKIYEYFAFISYSRKDEKWAKRIQQELEKYRLPMALCKELNFPTRNIRPIFRDVTDLSAGQLQDELHRQLNDSKKLIVICSPGSAKSEWVNKEIRHFIDVRGYENIIPLIVDGTPDGGDDECFPEALRLPEDKELLGVSVKELGWRDAFLRVVSGLLNVKFDSLKRRHEQRRKKQRIITASVAFLALALSGFLGYAAWDYYVPHEAYYADYVSRFGVPEGLGPLTEQELSVRSEHYVIVTKKKRVIRLTHANSAGIPIPHTHTERLNRPMIAQYSYGDDGNLRTVEYMDRNDNVLLAENYTPDLKAVDFVASGANNMFQTLSSSTTNMRSGMLGINASSSTASPLKSDITRHVFEYDENGFVTKIIYMRDNRQTPILDSDRIGGLEYESDQYGRPIEVRYLGLGGEGYVATRDNVSGKRYTYDDAYNLIREEYFDPQGAPVQNEMGWMISDIQFDANGNPVRQSHVDADGNPLPTFDGITVQEWEYDSRGNLTKESHLNIDGEPFLNSFGFASINAEYDEQGNETLWAAFGMAGEPVATIYGFSSMKKEYDDRGNLILESYFDPDGEPILIADGYASVRIEYNQQGDVSKATYLGIDGLPIQADYGYAMMEWEYDDRSRVTRASNFDTDGRPCLNFYGYSTTELDYDERGNLIRESRFGTDGLPILSAEGFASVTMDYDEYGSIIKVSFIGTDGKPIPADNSGGIAGLEWEYDDRGNIIKESYFGPDGQPILNIYGFSSVVMEYDDRGELINESYFDPEGRPVEAPN